MDKEFRKKIGTRIRNAREAKGMFQSELANLCGVSPQAVSSWESGRTEPKYAMLTKICASLGVTTADIVPATLLANDLTPPEIGTSDGGWLSDDWGDDEDTVIPNDMMFKLSDEALDMLKKMSDGKDELAKLLTEDELEMLEAYRKASTSAKLKAYAELIRGGM